jgi:3-deoxy-manno-octulosonate cytidylyltransferase (CMP-KDO synthetase)
LVLIPARYASTRFPGKPLAKIAGKSMIHWVYSHCSEANNSEDESDPIFDVAVVTDSPEIEKHVHDFGGKAIRIDEDVPSGTERIFLGWDRYYRDLKHDLVINVQGDEPLFKGEDIRELAEFHFESSFHVTTMVKKEAMSDEFECPNHVKVVWNHNTGHCYYFSRSPIPFDRKDNGPKEWFLHVGVYSYLPQALETFSRHPHGHYEEIEKLEQLRALEAGLHIGALETQKRFVGVDTPEDIDKVIRCLKESSSE